ncbi:unnamed protein product, partial [marine sediment metagenome]
PGIIPVKAEVGSKVKKFKPGMRAVAANSAPCNSCFYCKNSEHSLCDSLFIQLSGAFAEYIKIPGIIFSLLQQDSAL